MLIKAMLNANGIFDLQQQTKNVQKSVLKKNLTISIAFAMHILNKKKPKEIRNVNLLLEMLKFLLKMLIIRIHLLLMNKLLVMVAMEFLVLVLQLRYT